MLSNYEIDLAVVEGRVSDPSINAVMLDTDYLVCVASNNSPLAKQSMVTLSDLRRERMILVAYRRLGQGQLLSGLGLRQGEPQRREPPEAHRLQLPGDRPGGGLRRPRKRGTVPAV